MINWIEIDFTSPLPTVEVLATNGEVFLTGILNRISFTRVYCEGTKEELMGVTHYQILTKPTSKGKLANQAKFSPKPYVSKEEAEQIMIQASENQPKPKAYVEILENHEPKRTRGANKKPIIEPVSWKEMIVRLSKLEVGGIHSFPDLLVGLDQGNIYHYRAFLTNSGYIRKAQKKSFRLLKSVPIDLNLKSLRNEYNGIRETVTKTSDISQPIQETPQDDR